MRLLLETDFYAEVSLHSRSLVLSSTGNRKQANGMLPGPAPAQPPMQQPMQPAMQPGMAAPQAPMAGAPMQDPSAMMGAQPGAMPQDPAAMMGAQPGMPQPGGMPGSMPADPGLSDQRMLDIEQQLAAADGSMLEDNDAMARDIMLKKSWPSWLLWAGTAKLSRLSFLRPRLVQT